MVLIVTLLIGTDVRGGRMNGWMTDSQSAGLVSYPLHLGDLFGKSVHSVDPIGVWLRPVHEVLSKHTHTITQGNIKHANVG